MAVRRFDTGEITSVTRLDNGYLKAPARITKVGVFTYRNPNGTISRELRPPEEVFHADAIASFNLSPMTNDHPPVLLNAKNTRKYQVGSVTSVRKDASFVAADILITDDEAIQAAQKGKRELSCGYTCDTIAEPGVTHGIPGVPDGIPYDAVQRNIRGNHVALVAKGRAGSEASLRLDHGDAVAVEEATDGRNERKKHMRTIKIDGVDFEVSEQAYQAYQKALAKFDSEYESMSKAKTEAEKLAKQEKDRADKLAAELTETKKKLDEAVAPELVAGKVSSRLALVRTAEKILNDPKVKFDEMDDNAVRVAVIKKVFPNAKLDGKDDTYVLARFDSAVETAAVKPATNVRDLNAARAAASGQPGTGSSERGDSDDPVLSARERMIRDNANAHKQAKS